MKCQKCGTEKVNFHYSSNVNGCISETHLCSQCAAESGYDIEKLFGSGSMLNTNHLSEIGNLFNGMFPMLGNVNGFMPVAIPVVNTNKYLPFTMQTRTGKIDQGEPCDCGCGTVKPRETNIEVDEEMKLRRELNAQMRAAVEKEEFEKAAELRDRIKELEATGSPGTGRKPKCDSETNLQDSPTAQ